MGDGDELDALFDAFDGGEKGSDNKTREDEKEEDITMEDGNGTSTHDNDKGIHTITASDILRKVTLSDVVNNKQLFSGNEDVMAASSSTNNTPDKKTKDSSSKEAAAADEKSSVIATGITHDKSIKSYSSYPEGWDQKKNNEEGSIPKEAAKTYAFELDPFQKEAVKFVEKGESVLVAAHTSAGKTAVAEYAIAKSLRDKQRVVYTSPIKALSNQKYRDLQEEFDDVGLMTGDITINPNATCLVMTTEILRSMLYRGSEVMREVAWVIYDEVHYMRDKERGVVWEESIILLPHNVRFVFLSATIPNAEQFADWIVKIHHQPCHVVYTNYRPVPLQHYIFPIGGEGLHLVVDERGKFRQANFEKAMAALQANNMDTNLTDTLFSSAGGNKGAEGRKRKRGGGGAATGAKSDLQRIVKLIMERNLNPAIIFSFSKKDCEKYALLLQREDFTEDVEKELVTQVYNNAIEGLGEDDRKLPQVLALLPLLKRGIGIHHGGLLPILKEIVEILFSEGLIKVLFATETFSIGINMPAKTVVFTNCRKWDGKDFRWVTSGEYIQMSGRAGRRGKDDRGVVIQMLDEKMEPNVCKEILYGNPDPLNSSYRISYNMLLNMIRVQDVDPEYLLRASFHQFQQESQTPALEAEANKLEKEANLIQLDDENELLVGEYFQMDQQLHITRSKMLTFVRKPEYIVPFLQPGRLLEVSINGQYFGYGALIAYKRKNGTGAAGTAGQNAVVSRIPLHTIDIILPCIDRQYDDDEVAVDSTTITNINKDKPKQLDEEEQDVMVQQALKWRGNIDICRPVTKNDPTDRLEWRIFSLTFDAIQCLGALRIFIPEQTLSSDARKCTGKRVQEVLRRFPDGLPVLDPVKDMNIHSEDFQKLFKRAAALADKQENHGLNKFPEKERVTYLRQYGRKHELYEQVKALRKQARSCQVMVMKEDLKKMKKVLRLLGHVDADGVIQTKGRTACEINTADELIVVELVFSGIFNELNVEQSLALLSCLIFDTRLGEDIESFVKQLKSYLSTPFYKLQEITRLVAKSAIACKIDDIDEEKYVEKINPGMMEGVFAWCKGSKFVDVQKMCPTFEGNTIRTIRRLEELVRQLASASKAIGNHELQKKFETGSELLKRDIVFCSSLYL